MFLKHLCIHCRQFYACNKIAQENRTIFSLSGRKLGVVSIKIIIFSPRSSVTWRLAPSIVLSCDSIRILISNGCYDSFWRKNGFIFDAPTIARYFGAVNQDIGLRMRTSGDFRIPISTVDVLLVNVIGHIVRIFNTIGWKTTILLEM